MAKKIFDILPPEVAQKKGGPAKSSAASHKRKKSVVVEKEITKPIARPQSKTTKKSFPKMRWIVGSIVVLLLGIYLYNSLPKADIEIWPALDSVALQEKITVDKAASSVDIAKKIIPARQVDVEKEGSQEFPATGNASNDGKASGTIKIYNKISPSAPFTLKIGTHFLSDSGKYFVTLERVVITAAKGSSPGAITVKVEAEESGDAYNIKASKFSVPKLSGTPYYYSIWAESTSPMTGGYAGTVKKVTKDDVSSAKDVLTQKLLSQAESNLRAGLAADEVLLDGAITRNVIDATSDVAVNTVKDTFIEQAKVKVLALVFKKSDVEKFAKDKVLAQLPDNKELLENTLDITYTPDVINTQSGIATLNIKFSIKTYYHIDINDLVRATSMQSSDQIKEMIGQKYDTKISKLQVNFWPFWVKEAPEDEGKIHVNLHFE